MGYQWISQTCHKVHCIENCRHDTSAIVFPLGDFTVNIMTFFTPKVFSVQFVRL